MKFIRKNSGSSAKFGGTHSGSHAQGADAYSRSAYSAYSGKSVDAPYGSGDGATASLEDYSRKYADYSQKMADIRRSKRKRIVLICLAAALAIILGVAGVAFAYFNMISSNLRDGIDDELLSQLKLTDSPSDPFYMLLIGIDRSKERESANVYGGAYRTDSIILARIDPQNCTVTMVSVPRDTQVQIEGHGTQKINAAYAFNGPSGAVAAVSAVTGVPISHYAQIDFDGFKEIVDAMGGVEVNVGMEINDWRAGGHLDAGKQVLDGQQALILCRSRHAYDKVGDGDIMRAANQRLVIMAILKKIMKADMTTMTNSITTLSKYVTTDLSVTEILGLADSMRSIDIDKNIYTAGLPTQSVYQNNLWYELIKTDEWNEMMSRVDAGLSPTSETVIDSVTGVQTTNAGDGGASKDSKDSSSSIDLSGVTISVKNGAGLDGVASAAAKKLAPYGASTTTGNADSSSYPQTLIIYDDDSQKETADAIAEVLGVGQVKLNGGVYSHTGDILVVIGADWQ